MSSSLAELSWGLGLPIAGTPFRQVVTTAETQGRLSILAIDMPAGERVDEHVHQLEDQITVIVGGTVGATVADVEYSLGPGAVLLMPRGVPHAQWNASGAPARVLEVYTPGGFEQVFEWAGQLALAGQRLGPDEFRALRDDWAAGQSPASAPIHR